LKPSEFAPLSAYLFAEILHEAGVPAGVFNLVNGDGPTVGAAIAAHRDVDMVSFTGSTRAGVAVANAAAPTVKRVTQELGGKSANIILEDADLSAAVKQGVQECFRNTGQSCNAPTRMLVPRRKMSEAAATARQTAEATKVGDPLAEGTAIGPLSSKAQFEKVQRLIHTGIEEGAHLVAGGVGRPDGLGRGYFVKPTVFADVGNDMTIAREEIFGPVLCIIAYEDEEDAVKIANDSPYGLAGFVTSGNSERARKIAKRLRSGNVHMNGARVDYAGCVGGYKQRASNLPATCFRTRHIHCVERASRDHNSSAVRQFIEAKQNRGRAVEARHRACDSFDYERRLQDHAPAESPDLTIRARTDWARTIRTRRAPARVRIVDGHPGESRPAAEQPTGQRTP